MKDLLEDYTPHFNVYLTAEDAEAFAEIRRELQIIIGSPQRISVYFLSVLRG